MVGRKKKPEGQTNDERKEESTKTERTEGKSDGIARKKMMEMESRWKTGN